MRKILGLLIVMVLNAVDNVGQQLQVGSPVRNGQFGLTSLAQKTFFGSKFGNVMNVSVADIISFLNDNLNRVMQDKSVGARELRKALLMLDGQSQKVMEIPFHVNLRLFHKVHCDIVGDNVVFVLKGCAYHRTSITKCGDCMVDGQLRTILVNQ